MTTTTIGIDAEMAAILAIPASAVRRPQQPVGGFIQEAENLWGWVQVDRAALVAAGLPWPVVASLPARIQVLRKTEVGWFAAKRSRRDAAGKLRLSEPAGWALRNELHTTFRFAFRDNPDLLDRLAGISKGRTRSDLLQALNDLAVIGEQNIRLLEAIGLGRRNLDEAAMMSERLTRLLAMRDGLVDAVGPKEMRDRAFTHARRAVDLVRSFGRFVFRQNPDRLKGYLNEYELRRRRVRRPVGATGID